MKKVNLFFPSEADTELTVLIVRRIGSFGAAVQLPDREKVLEGSAPSLEGCDLVAVWAAGDDKHNRLSNVIRLIELVRQENGGTPIVFYHPTELAPDIRRYLLSLAVTLPNGQSVEDFLRAIEALLQVRDTKVPA